MLSEEEIKEKIKEEIKEEIRAEIREEIKKAEIKKAEIKKLTNEVNDLFRERNYFKTIMGGYSHLPGNMVKPEHDGDNPKYEDKKDFMYPTVGEYEEAWEILNGKYKEEATFIRNSKADEYPIPSPDKRCDDEYQDFKCLICCKKETEPKFFKDYTFDSICSGDRQLYYYKDRDSEDSLLRLSGDMLFHFDQLIPGGISKDEQRKGIFSLFEDDSSQTLINTFIKASALPGNYIFWRVTEDPKDEDEPEGSGVNSTRGGKPLGDRFDLALEALREWFTDDPDEDTLLKAFDAEKDAGYPFFLNKEESGWEDFVEFFELKGSFVDDDYRVYNQVASDPLKEEMGVAFDPDEWKTCTLRESWSDSKHDEGIPPEIENYLINGIKTIIERTERLNEVLHRA